MSPIPLHMLGINRRYFLGIFSETFRISTFSTIAPSYAKQIGRSPRVRSLERAKKQESLNPIQHNIPPQLPLALFDEAHKAGALGIPGSKAVHVLSQFQALGRRPSQKAIQQLCAGKIMFGLSKVIYFSLLPNHYFIRRERRACDLVNPRSHTPTKRTPI